MKSKERKQYRATYTITKTVTLDAHDKKDAKRELDHFFTGIRGTVELLKIDEVDT